MRRIPSFLFAVILLVALAGPVHAHSPADDLRLPTVSDVADSILGWLSQLVGLARANVEGGGPDLGPVIDPHGSPEHGPVADPYGSPSSQSQEGDEGTGVPELGPVGDPYG